MRDGQAVNLPGNRHRHHTGPAIPAITSPMEPAPAILYEDNHCLVVKKPFNMLVQPDSTGDLSLFTWAQTWIRDRYGKPGNVYVGIVHRLDRPAGGIVLLARTSKSAARLSEQFRQGRVYKEYLVVVEGNPGPPRELVHYLQKNPELNRSRVSAVPGRGRKSCLTIRNVQFSGELSLLQVQLETGRSHQIRAQLSHEGHPVVGDLRYGASTPLPSRNIALFAWRIAFEHPTRHTREVVVCNPPLDEFPWRSFSADVEILGKDSF